MPRPKPKFVPDYFPLRPDMGADWRWVYANLLRQQGRNASVPRDGGLIPRFKRYQQAEANNFAGRRHSELPDEEPYLHQARTISQTSGVKELEIKCRLLAGQSFQLIGYLAGLPEETIRMFSLAFFDVCPRLEARSYILHRVIKLEYEKPNPQTKLMMLSCFLQGPHAVDLWIDWLPHAGEFHDWQTEVGRNRQIIELFVLAQNLSASGNKERLTKLMTMVMSLRHKMSHGKFANQILSRSITEMLSEMCAPNATPETPVEERRQTDGRQGNSEATKTFACRETLLQQAVQAN